MTRIQQYVEDNFATLPQSTFDDQEVVIVAEFHYRDEGYGNHSYSGLGISSRGTVFYCFSSGCSCQGSCGTKHVMDTKALEVEGHDFNLESVDPADVPFAQLQVSFHTHE